MSKWLFFYEQRNSRSESLWVAFVGCTLATLCVFAGFNSIQWVIESTADIRNTAINQTGAPFVVSKYSLSQMYVLGIEGVKYQLWIALALIIRWFGLFAYRCGGSSARRKWLGIGIAEVSLILAIATFAWYSWLSYRVLVIETVCEGCMTRANLLLGASYFWASLLTVVMLVQTVYGIARLAVPLVDILRVKDARPET